MQTTSTELPGTSVSGMPRIGAQRELKRALEGYWAGRLGAEALGEVGAAVRRANWEAQAAAGVGLIASNDFSLYDQVLDAAMLVGAIPGRYLPGSGGGAAGGVGGGGGPGSEEGPVPGLDTYFAMARGGAVGGTQLEPLQLTKWFGTNYHHLVPELGPDRGFALSSAKPFDELAEAAALGVATKPVLVGPLSFLHLSRCEPAGLDPLSLLDGLVEVYLEVLERLASKGATWVQLDEPVLATDRSEDDLAALSRAYRRLGEASQRPRIVLSTSYGHVVPAMPTLVHLPVEGIGLDLCAGAANADALAAAGGLGARALFAGVIDGQRPWVSDLSATLGLLESLSSQAAHVVVSTSTSLLHLPVSLEPETSMGPVRAWLAFANEKLGELAVLAKGLAQGRPAIGAALAASDEAVRQHASSTLVRDPGVRARVSRLGQGDDRRGGTVASRRAAQDARLGLPLLPTTTIGSFPQTSELRAARAERTAGGLDEASYAARLREEVARVVAMQEELGLDVIVHGEPERDDMVRYFAAQLSGFVLTQAGWVQSYGSRCVRPPVLYGDVSRPKPMTLEWAAYAASLTSHPVKAMLTGPLTMLAWSFPRADLSKEEVATQLGLAISDEVRDLVAAGMSVIQVDEPGLAEAVPLRRAECEGYLEWATRAFRLAVAPAGVDIQVHSHMCYAEFGVLLPALPELEVDVLSLEAVRSAMALLGQLASVESPGQIGPGVYDVHASRVPEVDELAGWIRHAVSVLGPERVWVNPDCGLKTRSYAEVAPVLANLVTATELVRGELSEAPATVGSHG
ncbi:MAG: 5-methyltetrahydropteroyltriglutamate--homocysteine S-methyltransferase [Acidimicrobiales bacterium]